MHNATMGNVIQVRPLSTLGKPGSDVQCTSYPWAAWKNYIGDIESIIFYNGFHTFV